MKIVALDLGTKLGWAVHSGGTLSSGTQEFVTNRWSGGGMRYLLFARWLDELLANLETIDEVVYEEVRHHAGTDAAHMYGGFMAHLTAWAEKNRIPYRSIPVGTIKKWATGKGNAKKDDMIAAARATWPGQRVSDDNQADALWILATAMKTNPCQGVMA